jgi:glycine cleavage system aminomethyltransferase T
LHNWHAEHGARLIERDSWQIPASFKDPRTEVAFARTGLAICDISALPKLSLLGRGVAKVVENVAPQSPATRILGVGTWTTGSPALACRLAGDHLLLLAATMEPLDAYRASLPTDGSVVSNDVTTAFAGIALAGPHVEDFLRRATHLDVRREAFPEHSCAETNLVGVHALLIRAAVASVPSFRVYVTWDLAEYVWEVLSETGQRWNITPIGLESWQALHYAG